MKYICNNILLKIFVLIHSQKDRKPYHVGPCQHDMARPRFADGGDGLQTWKEGSCECIE